MNTNIDFSKYAISGACYARGEEGYEAARRAAIWHAGVPARYPDVIVQAENEADVVAAVKVAAQAGMKIAVTSGGHSWNGNHIREGGMLLSVSRLRETNIDADAMKATVQPGCEGSQFAIELETHNLFFPSGHDKGVAVGGYLLQGGYGWNGRACGPACMSVEAVDVVTIDGKLVHAEANQNADLYWAARGCGTGYFGVVTKFYLKVYPKPAVIALATHRYPAEAADEIFRWVQDVGPTLAPGTELFVVAQRDEIGEPKIDIIGAVFAATQEEADAQLAVFQACPAIGRAERVIPFIPTSVAGLYAAVPPFDHSLHWTADNMWTNAPMDELLPGIHKIIDTLPPAPSRMVWMTWGRTTSGPARPDMAYSVEADAYIALYGVGRDAAEYEEMTAWNTRHMREMEHLASGIQLADENLARRPARFITDENMARLDNIRALRDPAGHFHSWMGRLVALGG